ncbi:hypothetical protein D915_003036 [Fasciola hepatica]|uniref:Surfactant protein B n=1 Tax=Fasciola hepatica TaxID=6192 RepID=A0A4E0RGL0_FASHE|nr:hypothetical protein D915_003036 [Fasciola hepatica]
MACNLIGLCSGPLMQPISAVPAGSKYCTNCKVLVDLVYKELLQNGTEEEMKKWAKHMCTILPDTYASECNHLVEEYLPLVIRYLTESFTSEEVCEKIGFCPEQSGYQKALCLRGPAYWCLNRETAERCNATEICSTGRFTQSSARSLCDSRNRAQICASFELAAACGMTSECTKQLLLTYMHSVTHLLGLRPQLWSSASEGSMNQPNCTVCADMLAEWLTNRKYLGTPNFTVQICKKYSGSDDRAQCYRVWAQRYKIFRQMFRDNANPEAICKQMNLCQISATSPTSPCLENPLYAISSRRAAEQCGTLDLWNQVQKVETQPIKPATTEPPSRAVPPPPAESSACQGGPTTFCQTFETAQRCGDAGIRYCLEHVWFGSRPRRIIRAPPHLN